MTIASSVSVSPLYVGTGSVNTYAYNFLIYSDADLIVVMRNLEDTETELVLNTDYTVTGVVNSNGGNIVLSANLTSGYKLRAYRKTARTQEIDLTNQQSYFLEGLERGLDMATMQIQELQADSDRSLKTSVTSAAPTFNNVDTVVTEINTIKEAAELAETNAKLAETNAETAQVAAELAETNAETAQVAAELAETNAETAQVAAELAETNAETAQVAAAAALSDVEVAAAAALSDVEAAAAAALSDVEALQADIYAFVLTIHKTGYVLNVARHLRTLINSEFPFGITFSADGTKMYLTGNVRTYIMQYALSTAWDVSTATIEKTFSVASQGTHPYGVNFSVDGLTLFVTDGVTKDINRYTLSTAWDIATATYANALNTTAYDTPQLIAFSVDGTKLFVMGVVNKNVYQFALSTAWNVGTATYVQSFSVSAAGTPRGISFSANGMSMFIASFDANAYVYEYLLSTAWNVATAVYLQSFNALPGQYIYGIAWSIDGTRLYVTSNTEYILEFLTGFYELND
jgi:sugar lactone lactonase YvrE